MEKIFYFKGLYDVFKTSDNLQAFFLIMLAMISMGSEIKGLGL